MPLEHNEKLKMAARHLVGQYPGHRVMLEWKDAGKVDVHVDVPEDFAVEQGLAPRSASTGEESDYDYAFDKEELKTAILQAMGFNP